MAEHPQQVTGTCVECKAINMIPKEAANPDRARCGANLIVVIDQYVIEVPCRGYIAWNADICNACTYFEVMCQCHVQAPPQQEAEEHKEPEGGRVLG